MTTMNDQAELGRLLAVVDPAWATRILRTALTDLLAGAQAPVMTTPPTQGERSTALWGLAQPMGMVRRGLHLHALPSARRAGSRQTYTRRNSRKSEPSGRLFAAEWLALREQVEGEMQRRGIGMTELAAAIGRATATVTFLMVGRRPTLPTDHGLAACLPAPPEAGRDTRYTECARQDGNAVHGLHSARNGHNGAATRSGAKPVPWRRG